jgi:hypothetical protein
MQLFFTKHYIRNIVGYSMSTNTLDTTNPATCRALPTGIANLSTKIENCTRPEEKTRKDKFITNTLHLKEDIDSLRANVGDSLSVGESMFGSYGHSDITKQIRDRNHDLKKKKEDLIQDINKKESIIERANRDFTDVKRTLPEKQPKKILHFIEDYTMALLAISYLFMLCIGIYYFSTITSGEFNTSDFFKALMNGAILSIVVGVVIYYIS